MTCEDVRAMVETNINLSTRAMRVGSRRHVQECQACFSWFQSQLLEMARAGQIKAGSIARGVGIAINDDLSEDPEA